MFILTETVINLQDEEGFTPLMWAAAHGQIAVVEFLLQNVWKIIKKVYIFIISEQDFFTYCLFVILWHFLL